VEFLDTWDKFSKTQDPCIKEQLILEHLGLVKYLAGRLAAIALRTPNFAGTAIDLSVRLSQAVDAAVVNEALRAAAAGLPGVLGIADDPLVSADVTGDSWSCLFDPGCTRVAAGRAVGVLAWCDADWAGAARACDLLERLASGA